MILMLYRHEDGRPAAMSVARGKKEACEVSEPRTLLAAPPFGFLGHYHRHLRCGLQLILNASPVL